MAQTEIVLLKAIEAWDDLRKTGDKKKLVELGIFAESASTLLPRRRRSAGLGLERLCSRPGSVDAYAVRSLLGAR